MPTDSNPFSGWKIWWTDFLLRECLGNNHCIPYNVRWTTCSYLCDYSNSTCWSSSISNFLPLELPLEAMHCLLQWCRKNVGGGGGWCAQFISTHRVSDRRWQVPGNKAKPNAHSCSLVLLHSLESDLLPVSLGCSIAIFLARAGSFPPAAASTAITSLLHVGFPNLSTWLMGRGERKKGVHKQ